MNMIQNLEYYDGQAFPILENDCFLRAARGEAVGKTPVWIMRQAGRHLPEFRKLREQYGFFEICRSPKLACQITLQPIDRYDLDAAIIFSDILVIPEALGMEVIMSPGPIFPDPLKSPEDVSILDFDCNVYDKLSYVFKAIKLTRHELKGRVPLIGFSGGPWTLMCYMIEGSSSMTMSKAKKWLYEHELKSQDFLRSLSKFIVKYIIAQVEWGAQAIQIFESHAGILSPDLFNTFLLPCLVQIANEVKVIINEKGLCQAPMIIFCKGATYALEDLSQTSYDVVSVDWTVPPSEARKKIPNKTLQGNLDPCALYAKEHCIQSLVEQMINEFGPKCYIANLGHGIYPDVPIESVSTFIDSVHQVSSTLLLNEEMEESEELEELESK